MNKVRYGRADKTAKPEAKEDMGMRAKYDRMKKGCDCQDGSKGSCKCNKKDMGSMKKSPYADGCGYKEDSLASELNEVLTGVKMDGMGVKKFSKPEEEDETERDDLKCGKGSISKGEKCTKGTATEAQSRSERPSIRRGIATGAKYGALVKGIAGAAAGAQLGSMTGIKGAGVLTGALGALGGAVKGAVVGGAIGGGVNAVRRGSYKGAGSQTPKKETNPYKITKGLEKGTTEQLVSHKQQLINQLVKSYGKPITNQTQLAAFDKWAAKKPVQKEINEVNTILEARNKTRR